MATVERDRKSTRGARAAPRQQSRPRRFRLLVLGIAIGGMLPIAALPTLITCRPWCNSIASRFVAGSGARVSIGSVSLGWFTPLSASQITVTDPAGQPIATVASLKTEKSVLGLLGRRNDLGKILIDGFEANVVLREGGSNVEDLLAPWLYGPQTKSPLPIAFDLELQNGRVSIEDTVSKQKFTLDNLSVSAAGALDGSKPLDATVAAALQYNGGSSPLKFKLAGAAAAADAQSASSPVLSVAVQQVPLSVFQSIVGRRLPGTSLSGMLTCKLDCQADLDTRGQWRRTITGQLDIAKLSVGGPWLAGDRLSVEKLNAPVELVWQQARLDIRRLQLASDLGELKLLGSVPEPAKALGATSAAELLSALDGSSAELSAAIDLAQLAQQIPHAIGLKPGVQLTAGSATCQIKAQDLKGSANYTGTLDIAKIVAQHDGRELAWDAPLHARFAAHGEGRQMVVDQLDCESDFLEISGQASAGAMQASGKFDLGRLCDRLGQFVELGTRRMDGQGSFSAELRSDSEGAFAGTGQLKVERLQANIAGTPWTDGPWSIDAQLKGQHDANKPFRIDTAQLTGQLGADQVSARLNDPAQGPLAEMRLPLTVHVSGQLETWLARGQVLGIALPGIAASGQMDLQASAVCSPQAITIQSAVLTCEPLAIRSAAVSLNEAEARLEAVGRVDLQTSRCEGCKADLQTTSFSVELAEGGACWAAGKVGASGTVGFAGDLARLQNSLGLADKWRVGGVVNGKAVIQEGESANSADVSARIDNLVASPAQGKVISAGAVQLAIKGDYDRNADTVRLAICNLSSSLAQLEASGSVEQASTAPKVDLSGRWEYDLQTLTALLQPKFGNNIQLSGREARTFRVQGPLAAVAAPPPAANMLTGNASFGWEAANLYGFQLGPAVLEAQLTGSALRLTPAQLAVNGGQVNVAGQVQPLSPDGVFTLPPGVVVDHVQIAEKLGHPGLMFVLPMASRSQVQGQVSVAISNCQLPLGRPEAADVSGQVTIHELELIRGPFMQELAGLLNRNEPAQIAQNSVVPFRMVQGRIYHEGLELRLREMTVRTYGSVGLDRSLAIMAEVPVPLAWLPQGIGPEALKQRTIHVPIGGTLDHPQLDHREVERLAGEFLRNASENVLRGAIAKPLQRLLGPLEKPAE